MSVMVIGGLPGPAGQFRLRGNETGTGNVFQANTCQTSDPTTVCG